MFDDRFDPWFPRDVTPSLIPTAVTHRQTNALMSTPLTASKSHDRFESDLLIIDETGCETESFQKQLNETREQVQRQLCRS